MGISFGVTCKGVLTPPDRMRLKKDDILIEGPMALLVGVLESVGLLKRTDQGARRAAVYGGPHIWTGGEGGWRMMSVCLMGKSVSKAAKVLRQQYVCL